jgi:DNA-directed RNA polymerase subunit alpha
MNTIALPQKINIQQKKGSNQGIVTIEPCFPGYGTTIGNALRRVLLSSLPGAAVVGLKIKGAEHEFATLPHIQEDVLEIILNIKKIRLKVFSDEVVKLELNVHGEKQVTAGDIKPNSQVEIVNPDLVLANITDMAGNFSAEIYVSRGRGYETVDNREKKSREIGYIEVDSAFSPILNVAVGIENVRVGKMTNWEKLILNITTDGTIEPKEAFYEATKILIDQFKSLVPAEVIAKKEAEEKDKNKQSDEEEKDEEEKTEEGDKDKEKENKKTAKKTKTAKDSKKTTKKKKK